MGSGLSLLRRFKRPVICAAGIGGGCVWQRGLQEGGHLEYLLRDQWRSPKGLLLRVGPKDSTGLGLSATTPEICPPSAPLFILH